MIVVDSSALLAIIFREPEKQAFEDILTGGERCVMSAVNVHETASILRVRRGSVAAAAFWEMGSFYAKVRNAT
jgi:ribonuclease VapC